MTLLFKQGGFRQIIVDGRKESSVFLKTVEERANLLVIDVSVEVAAVHEHLTGKEAVPAFYSEGQPASKLYSIVFLATTADQPGGHCKMLQRKASGGSKLSFSSSVHHAVLSEVSNATMTRVIVGAPGFVSYSDSMLVRYFVSAQVAQKADRDRSEWATHCVTAEKVSR